jgi:toxin ParE1/3/4
VRISEDNRVAATNMVSRIREHINRVKLDALANKGRPGIIEGTKELLEHPYIIVYRISEKGDEIVILSVVHGAQDR